MKKLNPFAFGAALLAAAAGCGGDDKGPLGNIDSIVVLQRPIRQEGGDIFSYDSYVAGAKLTKLSPPTADGVRETLFPNETLHAEFKGVDISGYDISFDADKIVFTARTADTPNYGLYVLHLSDGTVDTLPSDPSRDYVSPIWLPGDKIMFTTNSIAESNARQFVDEYERGTTMQVGTINADGTNEILGARNLSHRVFPSLASDGRVIMTEWRHLGPENAGQLVFLDQDMSAQREGFGRESSGASNSTLKAREVSPGRFVAVATSRDRTLQSGALIDIRLGTVVNNDGIVSAGDRQAEARATHHILTPDVPTGRQASAFTIGRYYDAYPLDALDQPNLLVSWADGPVESGVLGEANVMANFGVYLLDTSRNQRRPILDDPDMWDIFPRPLVTRSAPPISGSVTDGSLAGASLIGSLNAYNSSLNQFDPGSIYGALIMEGFSSEEGFPEMFGNTMFEGQVALGVAPLAADGSWAAHVPGNVPLHIQMIDKFGMALANEPLWISPNANGANMCGGCHEKRDDTVTVTPGQLQAFSLGPVDLQSKVVRADRLNRATFQRDTIRGVPWAPPVEGTSTVTVNQTLQGIFNAKCVACHNPNNTSGVAGYSIMDPVTGDTIQIPFDLSETVTSYMVGGVDLGRWPASYMTLAGPDPEAVERGNLVIMGNFKQYIAPQNPAGSELIKKLNPPQQFPTQVMATRAFATQPHLLEQSATDLTADEYLALIYNIAMGGSFYTRENGPGLNIY